jgi:hypothetical protein
MNGSFSFSFSLWCRCRSGVWCCVRIGIGVWDICIAEGGAGALLVPRPSRGRSYICGSPLVGIFSCEGFLFNHDSPQREDACVTRKITRGLARINEGLDACLYMGNLDSQRDWGHAHDYVEMQWRRLQQEQPEDFVIATSRRESERRFVELMAAVLGWGGIQWQGEGLHETGLRADTGATVVRIDPRYFPPAEVETLLGAPPKPAKSWTGRRPPPWKNWWRRWWPQTGKTRKKSLT